MKAIRIQLDILYKVPEELANEVYERDLQFFRELEESFYDWDKEEDNPRVPLKVEVRPLMTNYEEDTNEPSPQDAEVGGV